MKNTLLKRFLYMASVVTLITFIGLDAYAETYNSDSGNCGIELNSYGQIFYGSPEGQSNDLEIKSLDIKTLGANILACQEELVKCQEIINSLPFNEPFDAEADDPDSPGNKDTLSKWFTRQISKSSEQLIKENIIKLAKDNKDDGAYKIKDSAYELDLIPADNSVEDYERAFLTAVVADYDEHYNLGYVDGKAAALVATPSANYTIKAHFCSTDSSVIEQTFSSDTDYNNYKNSHSCSEKSDSSSGCYQGYYSHTHNSSCYTTTIIQSGAWLVQNYSGPAEKYTFRCNKCGAYAEGPNLGCNLGVHVCNSENHLTCDKAEGGFYIRNCGYTYGEITGLSIEY